MSLLRALWEGWKKLAHRIGVFNTKVLLFLFYYLGLGPIAMLRRLFHPDPLHKRIDAGSLYAPAVTHNADPERATRQF